MAKSIRRHGDLAAGGAKLNSLAIIGLPIRASASSVFKTKNMLDYRSAAARSMVRPHCTVLSYCRNGVRNGYGTVRLHCSHLAPVQPVLVPCRIMAVRDHCTARHGERYGWCWEVRYGCRLSTFSPYRHRVDPHKSFGTFVGKIVVGHNIGVVVEIPTVLFVRRGRVTSELGSELAVAPVVLCNRTGGTSAWRRAQFAVH